MAAHQRPRHLRGASRGVAQAVAAWRERRAASLDQPVRFILPDLAILGIAQRPPSDLAGLRRVRGLDERALKKPLVDDLLHAIEVGSSLPSEEVTQADTEEIPADLRPAVTLVSAWVSQLARDLHIDTTLLATRSDLVDLLVDADDARSRVGWRAELVGDQIRRLVDGEAALAFDGDGGLLLEPRLRVHGHARRPGIRAARTTASSGPQVPVELRARPTRHARHQDRPVRVHVARL